MAISAHFFRSGESEGAPKNVKQGVNNDDAKQFKDQLTAAGATVEIK
jgi:large subunit ribosomal protein L7/L12